MKNIECFDCKKVFPFQEKEECPSCGGVNIQIISNDRLKEGLDAGVFYNIDPKTGKRAKNKKR